MSGQVPEEAVELAVRSRRARHDSCEYDGQYDEAREDLQAAAPAICKAERERIREALGTESVQNKIAAAIGQMERDEIDIEEMAFAIYRALLQEEGSSE